jgi:hypothetical protein
MGYHCPDAAYRMAICTYSVHIVALARDLAVSGAA